MVSTIFYSDKFFILFHITINKFYKFIIIQKFIIFHIIYNLGINL